ncbi:universal stress protein [Halalkalicoccus jeotgali]|uniref:UspA domain protein n=1 Tax=Halalkalicoccus jeotgali (strain DSM 18796 / CECT 7217 / JCM 14584 / KCTC 4019 / B3) TaxID=795797 RepID=D8J3N3_HALJB|nr:universal stress protein [Halalkalicoccus jeotgali]ADJ15340.1 uspA domain protein [Halalkalicoccus jeotgali B3]ELY35447.1 uspA domain-containing protein [Halalkalicoccus jeotgali B3]
MVIVAAIDRSDRAGTVVREAVTLGDAFDEPVDVVHVLTREEFVSLERTNVGETGEAVPVERVVGTAENIAAEAIATADADATPVGLIGDPADEIVEYARQQAARYVVVAGRKRSPVGKALFGSVVQSVLLDSECPVVSIRAESD